MDRLSAWKEMKEEEGNVLKRLDTNQFNPLFGFC